MTAPELVSGHIVAGKYAVQKLLFQGGATATYLAITAPRREVALKMYDPALGSMGDVLAKLARYQSVGAGLTEPLLLPIVESGTDASTGARYTVVDFNLMPPLAQLVELCPVAPAEMPVLLRQMARAVDALHASDIAHLSLHPHNVFVGPGPKYDVRVGDFGANLVRGALRLPDRSGRWFPWLAPEQRNDPAAGGKEADIFSMALLAFFAVTGKSYWRSCQQTRSADAWARELVGARIPISERAKELSVSLGPELDDAFARALAVEPARRFKTAREFSVAVNAAVGGRKDVTPAPRHAKTALGLGSAVPRPPSPSQPQVPGGPDRPRAPLPSQPRAPSPSQPQVPPPLYSNLEDDDDNVPTVANVPISFLASRATMMGMGGDAIARAIAEAAAKAPAPIAATASVAVGAPVAVQAPAVAPVLAAAPPAHAAMALAATVAFDQPPPEPTKQARADTPNMIAVTPLPPPATAAFADHASEITDADTELPLVDPFGASSLRRSRIRAIIAASGIALALGVGVLALASRGTHRARASGAPVGSAGIAIRTAEPNPNSNHSTETQTEQPGAKEEPSVADPGAASAVPPGAAMPPEAVPPGVAVPPGSPQVAPENSDLGQASPPTAPTRPRSTAAPATRPSPPRAPAPAKPPCGKFLKRCK
jgi:serine/threonine protein kinase